MALIDRVLPDAQALAREGGERPSAITCIAAIAAFPLLGALVISFEPHALLSDRGDLMPVATADAIAFLFAWRLLIDPSGRRRPVGANLSLTAAALAIAGIALDVLAGSDVEPIARPFTPIGPWVALSIVAPLALLFGALLGLARSQLSPALRNSSNVALIGLAVLVVIGERRCDRYPDRIAYLRDLPALGAIPLDDDAGKFWVPVAGQADRENEGRIENLRFHRIRGQHHIEDSFSIVDESTPNSPLWHSWHLAWARSAVVYREPLTKDVIIDGGGLRSVFIRGDPPGLDAEHWLSTSNFQRRWHLAPPRAFVVFGALGLALSLLIRLSPRRSRALLTSRTRRSGTLDTAHRLTLDDGEVFDDVPGDPGPVVAFDDRVDESAGYRGDPSRRAPRLFFGTRAALDEGLAAESAARDSLALAIAALAAAPLVGAAFAGVMW
ncbi:MAG: hypothetical protein ACHREM_10625 [Polyangiales bacterium]